MEQQINERFLKISSRLPYPSEISLGDDITMVIGGQNYILNCVKQETLDKQDGTVDRVFVLKSVSE